MISPCTAALCAGPGVSGVRSALLTGAVATQQTCGGLGDASSRSGSVCLIWADTSSQVPWCEMSFFPLLWSVKLTKCDYLTGQWCPVIKSWSINVLQVCSLIPGVRVTRGSRWKVRAVEGTVCWQVFQGLNFFFTSLRTNTYSRPSFYFVIFFLLFLVDTRKHSWKSRYLESLGRNPSINISFIK